MFASASFILFKPKGSQIKSELIIGEFKQDPITAPNYFSADSDNSLLKNIIHSEIKQHSEKSQDIDTQK